MVSEARSIARQIVEALGAAREEGTIHRDLKPGNIRISRDGVVKLFDFRLTEASGFPAGEISHSLILTLSTVRAGPIMGTRGYMSPEQSPVPVDKRTDSGYGRSHLPLPSVRSAGGVPRSRARFIPGCWCCVSKVLDCSNARGFVAEPRP
jgi:serine/threonine protein kinase